MNDVTIGEGAMSGKGLYAARDFKKDEVVIEYELTPITFRELKELSPEDYAASHNVNGQIFVYPEPARYVSHSENPNVRNDHGRHADIALRDIKAGELITVDARYDDVPVLKKVNALVVFEGAGGRVVVEREDGSVGRDAVVEDPFGNRLTLVDLPKGREPTGAAVDPRGGATPRSG